jgi:FkbM family methyltransferase
MVMADKGWETPMRRRASAALPMGVRRAIWRLEARAEVWQQARRLAALRREAREAGPSSLLRLPKLPYTVRVGDPQNLYILYKDIFVRRIYHFDAVRPDPLVLDCGSNTGMSVLYYKHAYPAARVIGFEPDPGIYPTLRENVERNGLRDVRLVQAAIGGRQGRLAFDSDGKYGSCLADHRPTDRAGWTRHEVPCVRLRDYLTEPVDYLKMNIEGAEHEALADAADRLALVREMVVEYHHMPGLRRSLHEILTILHGCGFEYLINDLDGQTNCGVSPPFRLNPDTRYYLLIYARRRDAMSAAA